MPCLGGPIVPCPGGSQSFATIFHRLVIYVGGGGWGRGRVWTSNRTAKWNKNAEGKKLIWDPARIQTLAFVRCSNQLSHWSSGIGAMEDGIFKGTVWFLGWISVTECTVHCDQWTGYSSSDFAHVAIIVKLCYNIATCLCNRWLLLLEDMTAILWRHYQTSWSVRSAFT